MNAVMNSSAQVQPEQGRLAATTEIILSNRGQEEIFNAYLPYIR